MAKATKSTKGTKGVKATKASKLAIVAKATAKPVIKPTKAMMKVMKAHKACSNKMNPSHAARIGRGHIGKEKKMKATNAMLSALKSRKGITALTDLAAETDAETPSTPLKQKSTTSTHELYTTICTPGGTQIRVSSGGRKDSSDETCHRGTRRSPRNQRNPRRAIDFESSPARDSSPDSMADSSTTSSKLNAIFISACQSMWKNENVSIRSDRAAAESTKPSKSTKPDTSRTKKVARRNPHRHPPAPLPPPPPPPPPPPSSPSSSKQASFHSNHSKPPPPVGPPPEKANDDKHHKNNCNGSSGRNGSNGRNNVRTKLQDFLSSEGRTKQQAQHRWMKKRRRNRISAVVNEGDQVNGWNERGNGVDNDVNVVVEGVIADGAEKEVKRGSEEGNKCGKTAEITADKLEMGIAGEGGQDNTANHDAVKSSDVTKLENSARLNPDVGEVSQIVEGADNESNTREETHHSKNKKQLGRKESTKFTRSVTQDSSHLSINSSSDDVENRGNSLQTSCNEIHATSVDEEAARKKKERIAIEKEKQLFELVEKSLLKSIYRSSLVLMASQSKHSKHSSVEKTSFGVTSDANSSKAAASASEGAAGVSASPSQQPANAKVNVESLAGASLEDAPTVSTTSTIASVKTASVDTLPESAKPKATKTSSSKTASAPQVGNGDEGISSSTLAKSQASAVVATRGKGRASPMDGPNAESETKESERTIQKTNSNSAPATSSTSLTTPKPLGREAIEASQTAIASATSESTTQDWNHRDEIIAWSVTPSPHAREEGSGVVGTVEVDENSSTFTDNKNGEKAGTSISFERFGTLTEETTEKGSSNGIPLERLASGRNNANSCIASSRGYSITPPTNPSLDKGKDENGSPLECPQKYDRDKTSDGGSTPGSLLTHASNVPLIEHPMDEAGNDKFDSSVEDGASDQADAKRLSGTNVEIDCKGMGGVADVDQSLNVSSDLANDNLVDHGKFAINTESSSIPLHSGANAFNFGNTSAGASANFSRVATSSGVDNDKTSDADNDSDSDSSLFGSSDDEDYMPFTTNEQDVPCEQNEAGTGAERNENVETSKDDVGATSNKSNDLSFHCESIDKKSVSTRQKHQGKGLLETRNGKQGKNEDDSDESRFSVCDANKIALDGRSTPGAHDRPPSVIQTGTQERDGHEDREKLSRDEGRGIDSKDKGSAGSKASKQHSEIEQSDSDDSDFAALFGDSDGKQMKKPASSANDEDGLHENGIEKFSPTTSDPIGVFDPPTMRAQANESDSSDDGSLFAVDGDDDEDDDPSHGGKGGKKQASSTIPQKECAVFSGSLILSNMGRDVSSFGADGYKIQRKKRLPSGNAHEKSSELDTLEKSFLRRKLSLKNKPVSNEKQNVSVSLTEVNEMVDHIHGVQRSKKLCSKDREKKVKHKVTFAETPKRLGKAARAMKKKSDYSQSKASAPAKIFKGKRKKDYHRVCSPLKPQRKGDTPSSVEEESWLSNQCEKDWLKSFEKLKRYIKQHRDSNNIPNGHSIEKWVNRQRGICRRWIRAGIDPSKTLSDKDVQSIVHISRLNSVGFDWDYFSKEQVQRAVEAASSMLSTFQQELLSQPRSAKDKTKSSQLKRKRSAFDTRQEELRESSEEEEFSFDPNESSSASQQTKSAEGYKNCSGENRDNKTEKTIVGFDESSSSDDDVVQTIKNHTKQRSSSFKTLKRSRHSIVENDNSVGSKNKLSDSNNEISLSGNTLAQTHEKQSLPASADQEYCDSVSQKDQHKNETLTQPRKSNQQPVKNKKRPRSSAAISNDDKADDGSGGKKCQSYGTRSSSPLSKKKSKKHNDGSKNSRSLDDSRPSIDGSDSLLGSLSPTHQNSDTLFPASNNIIRASIEQKKMSKSSSKYTPPKEGSLTACVDPPTIATPENSPSAGSTTSPRKANEFVLPEGWTVEIVPRKKVGPNGKRTSDKYYISDTGRRFRSTLEVERFLKSKSDPLHLNTPSDHSKRPRNSKKSKMPVSLSKSNEYVAINSRGSPGAVNSNQNRKKEKEAANDSLVANKQMHHTPSLESLKPSLKQSLKPLFKSGDRVFAPWWPDQQRQEPAEWYPGKVSRCKETGANGKYGRIRWYDVAFDDGDVGLEIEQHFVFLEEDYLLSMRKTAYDEDDENAHWIGVTSNTDEESSDLWAKLVGWYTSNIDGKEETFSSLSEALRAHDSYIVRCKRSETLECDLNLPEEWSFHSDGSEPVYKFKSDQKEVGTTVDGKKSSTKKSKTMSEEKKKTSTSDSSSSRSSDSNASEVEDGYCPSSAESRQMSSLTIKQPDHIAMCNVKSKKTEANANKKTKRKPCKKVAGQVEEVSDQCKDESAFNKSLFRVKPLISVSDKVYALWTGEDDVGGGVADHWYPGRVWSVNIVGSSSYGEVKKYDIVFDDGDMETDLEEIYVMKKKEYEIYQKLPESEWIGVKSFTDPKSDDEYARSVGWYDTSFGGIHRSFALLGDALRAHDKHVIETKGKKVSDDELNFPKEKHSYKIKS